MVIGRIRIKRLELFRILHRAEFCDIERAIRRKLDPQHVVNAHLRNDRSHQIGMLRDHRAHQKAAIASALDRKFLRSRVFLLDQVFACSGEIIEHVLLFCEIAGLVPAFTELPAAADICHHIETAAIEPEPAREIEIRRHADPVSAVTVKQRRVLPVAFHAFSKNDVDRNSCAVL